MGVVRPGGAALAALKEHFELEVATEEVQELLAAHCDGIVVSSPHALHYEHTLQALRAGAHVIVEKPMCLTLREALALQREVKASGKQLTVAYGYNYLAMTTWAADLVKKGTLGRPLSITGYMASTVVSLMAGETGYGTIDVGPVRFEAETSTWADATTGGGFLYGQLSHLVGLAMVFFDSNPARVFSITQRLPNGVDIDVSVVAELADGSLATLSGNGRLPLGPKSPMRITLVCEEGSLVLDFENDRAEAFFGDGTFPEPFDWKGEIVVAPAPDAAWQTQPGDGVYNCEGPAAYLVSCCTGGTLVNRAPIDLGVRAVAILEAAQRSAVTGQTVWPDAGEH